jgi:hypothetical protein
MKRKFEVEFAVDDSKAFQNSLNFCSVEPEKMRIVKRISPLNYSIRASLRIGGSCLWKLVVAYSYYSAPTPLPFFTKDMAGFELAKAQLSSSAATAGDNDNSHPLKSCKGQCLLLLVET